MNRFYLPLAFKTPDDYVIPPLEQFKTDTQHPELNSKTFRYEASKYTAPNDYLPFYSHLIQNEDGLFILGTNDYTTSVLTGVLGGTYDFNEYITCKFKKARFSAVLKDNILGMYLLDRTTFATALSTGKLELYSTKAQITLGDVNHREKFCFVKIASQVTDGECTCLCVSFDKSRFIIGTSRGHFECYEHDCNGLFQTFTVAYGMSMEITGISAHPKIDANWVSTSSDKSCLLWDKRLVYSANPIIQNHPDRFTDVHWYSDETIVLSDSGGNVLIYDIRNPRNPLSKQFLINRLISSMKFKDNKFGIVTESTKSLVYEITTSNEVKLLHKHDAHPIMINDFCWDIYNKNDTCYVVGDEKYAKEINLLTDQRSNEIKE